MKLRILFLWLLTAFSVQAQHTMSIMSTNILLHPLTSWVVYSGGDAPEKAYQAPLISAGSTSLNNIPMITNGVFHVFPPGTYNLFISAINYDAGGSNIIVTAGSATFQILLNDRDANRKWSYPTTFTTASSFTNLSCVWSNAHASLTWRPILLGVMVTDDLALEVDVNSDERNSFSSFDYPTSFNTETNYAGNLIINGSFETGFVSDFWTWTATLGSSKMTNHSAYITTNAFSGNYAFSPPEEGVLVSRAFLVPTNQLLSISAQVRGALIGQSTYSLRRPATQIPTNPAIVFSNVFNIGAVVLQNTNYHKAWTNGYSTAYPDHRALAQLYIHLRAGAVIDDIAVFEGTTNSAYVEGNHVTVDFNVTNRGGIYHTAPIVPMVAYNSGDTRPTRIVYQFYDYWNRLMFSNVWQFTAPPGRSTNNISTGFTRYGWYRATAFVESLDNSHAEKTFSYIPTFAGTRIGTHPDGRRYVLETMTNSGFMDLRLMSAAQPFRWKHIEKTNNVYTFTNDVVDSALHYNQRILGVLGVEAPDWVGTTYNAAWIENWRDYVSNLVAHFTNVTHWEFWNEWQTKFTDDTFVTNMWITAYHAMTNANPGTSLVGFGGCQIADANGLIALMGPGFTNYLGPAQTVSTHMYNDPTEQVSIGDTGDRAVAWNALANTYGLKVWNTEAGTWDRYPGQVNYITASTGIPVWNYLYAYPWTLAHISGVAEQMKNIFLTLGYLDKYFVYDSRTAVEPNWYKTHTTIMSPNDTLQPKGVAAAMANWMIATNSGRGNISANTNIQAILFGGDAVPVVAAWSIDNETRELTLGAAVTVHDIMGNKMYTNAVVRVARIPVYFSGLSESALFNAVNSMSVASATDTNPPNVSLSMYPLRPFTYPNKPTLIRGVAIDEYTTDKTTPPDVNHGLVFSYKLEPIDADWRPWTFDNELYLTNLPPELRVIHFRARDPEGNVGITSANLQGGLLSVRRLNTVELNTQ